jgi:hypothetical protein
MTILGVLKKKSIKPYLFVIPIGVGAVKVM